MTVQQAAQYQLPIIAHSTKSGGQVNTVNLRDLHRELQNKDHFATWVKDRIAKYGFEEGKDFATVSEMTETVKNGKAYRSPRTEYHGTIDMAKELAMVENNDRGREIRRYFIDAEKRLREAKMAPPMPLFLRRMVANMNNVPAGHFSILMEVATVVIGPMEALGWHPADHLWPDISAGKMFCNWLRERGEDPAKFPTYPHVFEDDRPTVRAKAYPNRLLEDVRTYLQTIWLPYHAATYFKDRDRSALVYLPLMLGAPT